MKKKKYMVNLYLVFMSGVAMALATPMVAGIIYWMWRDYNAANVDKLNDFIFVTVGFGSLYLMLPVIAFINAYEYLGTVEITDAGLVFRAPFRRKREFRYEELCEFGIDYGGLSVGRQYWIYFCKAPFDKKYRHSINRMPFNGNWMRIQYREDVYKALYAAAPKAIQKRWDRYSNGIRADGYDKKKSIRIM